MARSTRTRYGKKITIQDLGADSSEQYVEYGWYMVVRAPGTRVRGEKKKETVKHKLKSVKK